MKTAFKPMSWLVKNFNCNSQTIEDYDVLKYREDQIKKFKKKCATKAEFAEQLRGELHWQYWSRAEYELIVEIDDDGHIWLKPWVGCGDPDKAKIDVTRDSSFDWKSFAKIHIGRQRYKNCAKVDIWDQLCFGNQFEKLVTYLWTTRFKYERDHPKFHEQ